MSQHVLQRLFFEATYLVVKYGSVWVDNPRCRFVRIERFPLPRGCNARFCALVLEIPVGYPQVPPPRFYIPDWVRCASGRMLEHTFQADGDWREWLWGSLHCKTWRPTTSPLRGHSLLSYCNGIEAHMPRWNR